MISNDWFLEMLMYGTYTERETRFFLIYQLSVAALSFIVVLLFELFWRKKGEDIMSRNYHEEYMEAEDLSCAEDEDRIFILDENGKSVEVEVEDDVADD